MAQSVFPPQFPKRKVVTLTSGTSWTVPTSVRSVNVTLVGGGGGTYGANYNGASPDGGTGQSITSTVATTPGASITYAIGAGGAGGGSGASGSAGGTTTFTGATSATGGGGGPGASGSITFANNGGRGGYYNGGGGTGGTGGSGFIVVEYWV